MTESFPPKITKGHLLALEAIPAGSAVDVDPATGHLRRSIVDATADPAPRKITVDDMLRSPSLGASKAIAEHFDAMMRRQNEAAEADAREHIVITGRAFRRLAGRRRSWDPRRIGDLYVARRCARLDPKGLAELAIFQRGGKVVYDVTDPSDLYPPDLPVSDAQGRPLDG